MTTSNAVATRDTGTEIETSNDNGGNALTALRSQLDKRSAEFKMLLPSHITPEKFQRTVITAVQTNPKLLQCNRQSFIMACMKAAQDALLPDGREAALVPFNTRQKVDGEWKTLNLVQYMPMVYGLRKKILQSGEVRDIFASVVYRQEIEGGLFVYEEGTERTLRHKPLLDPAFDPSDDDICAAYSVATFGDGSQSFEVMRRSDINKVRECSQTGALFDRQGKKREPSGPWVDWFSEQAKKSVIRRHSKTLPMSGDIIDVEAIDDILHARSTANVLGAVAPDEPEPLAIPPRRGQIEAPETSAAGELPAEELAPQEGEAAAPSDTFEDGKPDSETGEAFTDAEEPHPAEIKAAEIISKAKRALSQKRIDDLRAEYAADLEAMPTEARAEIEEAFAKAEARVGAQ